MSNRFRALLVAVLIWGAWIPRPAAAKDTLHIVSLFPPAKTPLRVGDTIRFEIKVELDVTSAASRRLHVWIYHDRGQRFETLAAWTQIQPKGRDAVTFNSIVRVPQTGRISVQAAIAEGWKPFLAFEARDYELIDASGKRIKVAPSP